MRFCDTKRKIARFSVAPHEPGGFASVSDAWYHDECRVISKADEKDR